MTVRRQRRRAGTAVATLWLIAAAAAGAADYPANPAVSDEIVCVSASGLVCLDAEGLSRRWRALAGEHTLEPVIAAGTVLVGGGAGLHAFAAATGERRWHWAGKGLVFTPTVAGGVAYVSDRAGTLAALDLATGAERWRRSFAGWSYPPAVIGGRLVTGGQGGIVRALAPADGATLWRRDVEQELVYRPVAHGERAIVTTFDGRAIALDARGDVLWQRRDPVPSFSPAPAGELLLFGGMDGVLRARSAADGDLAWKHAAAGQLAVPARYRAAAGQAALADADDAVSLLAVPGGRLVQRRRLARPVLGAPFWRRHSGWTVLVEKHGTILSIVLSQNRAGD